MSSTHEPIRFNDSTNLHQDAKIDNSGTGPNYSESVSILARAYLRLAGRHISATCRELAPSEESDQIDQNRLDSVPELIAVQTLTGAKPRLGQEDS